MTQLEQSSEGISYRPGLDKIYDDKWTAREQRVTELDEQGLSLAAIGYKLKIKEGTVRAHRYNAANKVPDYLHPGTPAEKRHVAFAAACGASTKGLHPKPGKPER